MANKGWMGGEVYKKAKSQSNLTLRLQKYWVEKQPEV